MSIDTQSVEPQSNLIAQIPRSSRSARIGSLLLLLQSLGLAVVIVYYLSQTGWIFDSLYLTDINIAVFGVILIPLILLTFAAAVVTLFMRRSGWIFSMLVQGFILYVCLDFYFSEEEPFWAIYPIMLSAVLMILYLDSFIVKSAFYQQPTSS